MGREKAEEEEARYAAERDATYRAVGRYFISFSRLVAEMRRALGRRLDQPEYDSMMFEALFSELMAMSMSRAFFAACSMLAKPPLDESERKIAKRLNAIVRVAIEDRNELAHGDWLLLRGWEPDAGLEPKLTRFRLTSGNPRPELVDVSAPTLEKRSDALDRLNRLVREFGELCLPDPNATPPYGVGERFSLEAEQLSLRPSGISASQSEFRS